MLRDQYSYFKMLCWWIISEEDNIFMYFLMLREKWNNTFMYFIDVSSIILYLFDTNVVVFHKLTEPFFKIWTSGKGLLSIIFSPPIYH